MDLRKLKTLIDLVADSTIAELEVTEGDSKVRIVKNLGNSSPQMPQMQYLPIHMPVPAAAPVVAAPLAASDVVPVEIEGNIVKAPMVGTFYRSAGPDKPSYVELGQAVKSAEPICIIEAMKLMNEIEAGFDGVIKEILVESGQPVEFGQPLFRIE